MLQVVNPATEEVICELQEDTVDTVGAKFRAARDAQPQWASRPLLERIECVKKFSRLLQERQSSLATTLTSEVGKPLKQAMGEIAGVVPRIEFFVENIEKVMEAQTLLESGSGSLVERVSYEPLGVVGNISAWNYPYFVGANVFVPALLVGNAVLYKPSEFSTLTGLAIGELLLESGVPEDVFSVVVGGGRVGQALCEEPLGGMFFTGSHSTGVKVAAAAARRMMRLQVELGGKDPVYVAPDVDVRAAAEGIADGAFYNAGQSCCSVERVYVHQSIYHSFVEHFISAVSNFVCGDPREKDTYIGPLTRGSHRSFLEAQVRDALTKGARLLTGGKSVNGKGYYFEPTVLSDVNHEMDLMREESFGPIIGLQSVETDDEAIQLMNDTRYGLTASVFTADKNRADKMLAGLNAGSVYWNCCDRVSPRLPWTGWNDSGVGSTLGIEGIRAFLQPKAWHLRS